MPEQNLNPDALEAAKNAFDHAMGLDTDDYFQPWEEEAPSKYRDIGVEPAVSAYLAALPAQPDTVTTLAELEALPPCSVIVDKHGDAGLIEYGHVKFAETAKLPMSYVAKRYLPATVIYRPVEG